MLHPHDSEGCFSSMIPRDGSLSNGCTPDRCCFPFVDAHWTKADSLSKAWPNQNINQNLLNSKLIIFRIFFFFNILFFQCFFFLILGTNMHSINNEFLLYFFYQFFSSLRHQYSLYILYLYFCDLRKYLQSLFFLCFLFNFFYIFFPLSSPGTSINILYFFCFFTRFSSSTLVHSNNI